VADAPEWYTFAEADAWRDGRDSAVEELPDVAEIRRIVERVKAKHAGRISTHYDECWMYHAGCLAKLIGDVLKEGTDG
jgi:hypothetical protein